MNENLFLNSELFTWIILPGIIFIARICDVTIGTIRIIFVSKGNKILAPILGFFEILIWLLAIGQIFKNLDNVACYIAYAGGFAMGNYVGIFIEQKLAVGIHVIRIITRKDASKLIEKLKSEGFGITLINGNGKTGPIKIIYTLIRRKEQSKVQEFIQQYNPKAFYSIEDVCLAHEGVFPKNPTRSKKHRHWFKLHRKGK
jgi:uncharacterized protein YebE (UPF0316 family)